MKEKMITPHVFLDTQVFRKLNFNYNSDTFQQVIEFTKREKIFLYSTTITIKEVEAHLVREVQSAKTTLNKARKECQILSNLVDAQFDRLFHSFDAEKIIEKLIEQFANFTKETNTKLLPITDVPIEDIFKKYFQSEPPFREGKKKYEFPDAFVLAAIENWCINNKQKIYIVSGDQDIKIACEENIDLIWLEDVDKLIELLVVELENDERIACLGYEALEQNLDLIQQLVTEQFPQLGFYLNHYDGEVTDVIVKSVEIIDESLANIGEDFVLFKLNIEVYFDADISYDDLESSPWNSDDKEYIWINQIEESISQNVTIPVKVKLLTFECDISKAKIERVELNNSELLEISIEREDY